MLLSKTNKADIPLYVGSFLMTLFILVVMIDPTNTLLHKKDIAFVLTVAYNMVLFKPDFGKLPYIMLMFCAVAVPWIFSTMRMTPVDCSSCGREIITWLSFHAFLSCYVVSSRWLRI